MSAIHWPERAAALWPHHLAGVLAAIVEWLARHEDRRELGGLSDRALRDIGLTRAEAMREVEKPFWRA